VVSKAKSGDLFISDFIAPRSWKRYEIYSAYFILQLLIEENARFDSYRFDARVKGTITGEERQVDLLILSHDPFHMVACEFRHYSKRKIPIKDVEAFASKLADISANKGVIVTTKGYQRGAIATATHHGIALFKLRELPGGEVLKEYPNTGVPVKRREKYWVFEGDDGLLCIGSGNLTEKPLD
jgi:hypothetical protein